MIIEYTSGQADYEIKGKHFTAYKWNKSNETMVIYDLWEVVKNNIEETPTEMFELLKLYYANKTVKSKATLSFDKESQEIEITNKSVIFPNILIRPNGN